MDEGEGLKPLWSNHGRLFVNDNSGLTTQEPYFLAYDCHCIAHGVVQLFMVFPV